MGPNTAFFGPARQISSNKPLFYDIFTAAGKTKPAYRCRQAG
jgi:hypothetical protein